MGFTYGFFDAELSSEGKYDRAYNADQFAEYFNLIVSNGVFPTPATQLQVVANTTADMGIKVSAGYGWINGYFAKNDSPYSLSIKTASGSLKRIDAVVLRWIRETRSMELAVKTGTAASSPSLPGLTRNDEVYELMLAYITLSAGATKVTQSMITDTRTNSSLCGIVTGAVQSIDTTNLFAQYDAAFQDWFDNLKAQLGGNVATNLQTQIDALVERANTADLERAELYSKKQDLDSLKGYLSIFATYASSGGPAKNVYFRGISGVDESLLRTDENGEFFAELPVGSYTLDFRAIVGEDPIPSKTILISGKKITKVELSLKHTGQLNHITESGEYLIGQDATSVDFFGVGGGGSGGGGGMPSSGGAYASSTSGGGGGYTATKTVDLSSLRGQFLTVEIGAGATGEINSSGSESNGYGEAGATGGTTTIKLPNGTTIISAAGGEGGHGSGGSTSKSSYTATGGLGGSQGVSSTFSRDDNGNFTATFVDSASKGVRVFGNASYPLVSVGGSGQCATGSAGSAPTNLFRSSVGSQNAGTDGVGNGGGGNCKYTTSLGNFRSGYSGGSGAVFFK